MSVTDWLYMLSVIHLIVYSFLDLSVCRTLLPICLSERIFFSETQVRESSKWSDGHLSIRQICLSAYSVYLYTHLSVCLFVCLFVCLSGRLFHYSLGNKLRLTLLREACAESICFLTGSLILSVLGK